MEDEAEEGLIITPHIVRSEVIGEARKYDVNILTYDIMISDLKLKEKQTREAMNELIRAKEQMLKEGAYSDSYSFSENIQKVEEAKESEEKAKSLENLIVLFAQKLLLKDIRSRIRLPSSEIDVFAKNDRTYGIWREFGTPILFECKNWDKKVTANEIRNFCLKATPAKTRFFIAWNGISGRDELRGAKLEIIKAKERGTFILVLTKMDFKKISGGIDPEFVVSEKYYGLIRDVVL